MHIASSGEWPIFEVLVNPRRLNLFPSDVYLRDGGDWLKTGGTIPARPVLAKSPPPSSPQTHKKPYHPSSYLAFGQFHTYEQSYYYYPGVVQELDDNGTLAFYHGLYNVRAHGLCSVYVMAVLNRRLPPPPIDYSRQFNKA